MKPFVIALALFAGQAMTLQDKPVVHLRPHTNAIDATFRGSLLELSQPPATLFLPTPPPGPGDDGTPWTIDVKNFGPSPVTIVGRAPFSVPVAIGQTVHIVSNGRTYLLKH